MLRLQGGGSLLFEKKGGMTREIYKVVTHVSLHAGEEAAPQGRAGGINRRGGSTNRASPGSAPPTPTHQKTTPRNQRGERVGEGQTNQSANSARKESFIHTRQGLASGAAVYVYKIVYLVFGRVAPARGDPGPASLPLSSLSFFPQAKKPPAASSSRPYWWGMASKVYPLWPRQA